MGGEIHLIGGNRSPAEVLGAKSASNGISRPYHDLEEKAKIFQQAGRILPARVEFSARSDVAGRE
jgi:hypothetical protein